MRLFLKSILLYFITTLFLGGCVPKTLETVIDETVSESGLIDVGSEQQPEHEHKMETFWYGEPPNCVQGGYRIEMCSECGWIDELRSGTVSPLEHELAGEEIQHGNCVEDTIVVYICKTCGEQIRYERYPEPDEHKMTWQILTVWDEEGCCFKEEQVDYCERCNKIFD